MKINLYPCFKHWNEYNNIFIYSDPHFSDQEMCHLRKNYIGDLEQVNSINSKVGKRDLIIFLGDIGNVEFIKKIRGYKVLIMGNHDKGISNYLRKNIDFYFSPNIVDGSDEDFKLKKLKREGLKFDSFVLNEHGQCFSKYILDNKLFDEVYAGPLIINDKIILSHEPLNISYLFNIYGHDHSNRELTNESSLNVCAEHINYLPVSLSEIIKSGKLKNIKDIHRFTIDKAILRTKS